MESVDKVFRGNIVDVVGGRIYRGFMKVRDAKIIETGEEENDEDVFILPGLVDSHIHIESSMLVPSEFARLAVVHGTVATVSDPHEIANVLGLKGVRFMIENGKSVPFKFYFGAPSCVPATCFETAGAEIGLAELEALLQSDDVFYLSEMMNFPGVLYEDALVSRKLELALKYHKPVDGHAPGLTGELAEKYVRAGISTDHECHTMEEALEKIGCGMHILIREGSAAKNFDALSPLIDQFPEKIMFCSDDKHPDDLVAGHVNLLIKRAFKSGYDKMKVIRCATLNPARHYHLDVGLLQPGDAADFILVDDLDHFSIQATYVNGRMVAENGASRIPSIPVLPINNFHAGLIKAEDIAVKPAGKKIRVIKAKEGQLLTEAFLADVKVKNHEVSTDPANDLLKLVVVNRYSQAKPAVGFIHGFGFTSGAIASSVAHDCHNIISVGTDDKFIVEAINALIASRGGISLAAEDELLVLPLPVAGIMSDKNGYDVATTYKMMDQKAREKLKSKLNAPFMILSFMSLLVIPELKLSDKGLFDGNSFSFTELFEQES